MISNEEIVQILKDKKIKKPNFGIDENILQKSLWILQICKDNTPAESLSPQGISYVAHKILEEDIKKDSISRSFSRAGKKVKNVGNRCYEIMSPGRQELKKYEEDKNEEDFKERFYDSGNQFDFYLDIKKIIANAKKSIFIIDSYVEENLFEMYIEKAQQNIEIKILTNSIHPRGNFVQVSRMFAKKHGANFEARESLECHDRQIFVDDSGWVIGQSIKDNARNKPAYFIKLINPSILKKMQERIWNSATKIT